MPEGDTIHRAARTLQRALAGKTVTRFETVLPQLARVDESAAARPDDRSACAPAASISSSTSPATSTCARTCA